MAKRAYAKRYSQAVFEIAHETGELDRWQSDLDKIASLGQDTEITTVMENPRVHFREKSRLLCEWLGDISSLALNLVYMLVLKGRLSIAAEIASGYRRLLDSYRGIEQVIVTTAVPLDAEDKIRLGDYLSAAIGKEVVLWPKVDANIISGIIIRIGDKIIDDSTHSKLLALKKEMSQ